MRVSGQRALLRPLAADEARSGYRLGRVPWHARRRDFFSITSSLVVPTVSSAMFNRSVSWVYPDDSPGPGSVTVDDQAAGVSIQPVQVDRFELALVAEPATRVALP